MKKKDKDVEVAILLEVARPDPLPLHKTFKLKAREVTMQNGHEIEVHPAEGPQDYEVILKKFTQHCKPRKNTAFERHVFWP